MSPDPYGCELRYMAYRFRSGWGWRWLRESARARYRLHKELWR